jgi:hypothetical protein
MILMTYLAAWTSKKRDTPYWSPVRSLLLVSCTRLLARFAGNVQEGSMRISISRMDCGGTAGRQAKVWSGGALHFLLGTVQKGSIRNAILQIDLGVEVG